MSEAKPEIPDNASIRYEVPHRTGSGYWRFDNEEKARMVAASQSSNGSGFLRRRITWGTHIRGESWDFSTTNEYVEDLEPVTDFSKGNGQWTRDQYLLKRDCKHETTTGWRLASGAGCQKDYAKYCTICGQAVDWQ